MSTLFAVNFKSGAVASAPIKYESESLVGRGVLPPPHFPRLDLTPLVPLAPVPSPQESIHPWEGEYPSFGEYSAFVQLSSLSFSAVCSETDAVLGSTAT